MSLNRSTLQADSVREECLCVRQCEFKASCDKYGRWHNHVEDVCPVHPDTVVDQEP